MKSANMGEKKTEHTSWNDDCERLVLYADFMGFKNRVRSTLHETLRGELTHFLDDFRTKMQPLLLGDHLKITQFSDSILIVANGTNQKMMNLLTKAAVVLFHKSLSAKLPIKGVIAQGTFTYDKANELYFGRPLIDAYLLHEEIKYYGVVVHCTAEKTVKAYLKTESENIYANTPVYLESGKVRHYHLCWNLMKDDLDYGNITNTCENWLDDIAENVSGKSRLYIDRTLEILHEDAKQSRISAAH